MTDQDPTQIGPAAAPIPPPPPPPPPPSDETAAYLPPPEMYAGGGTSQYGMNLGYAVDIAFVIDITGSMSDELRSMKSVGFPNVVAELRCARTGAACALDSACGVDEVCFEGECITDPRADDGCIPDIWTGVGGWGEVHTFRNYSSLGPDPTVTAHAVPSTGAGSREAPFHPPHCVASVEGPSNSGDWMRPMV